MLGSVALAILAIVDKSAVMFVSAVAIAVVVYVFRSARTRDRVIGIIAAGLGGGIGAEILRTFYYHANAGDSVVASEGGGLFMSAILIGVINVAAIIALLILTQLWLKFFTGKSR